MFLCQAHPHWDLDNRLSNVPTHTFERINQELQVLTSVPNEIWGSVSSLANGCILTMSTGPKETHPLNLHLRSEVSGYAVTLIT